MGYSARVVGIEPPSVEALEARLKQQGVQEEKLEELVAAARAEMEQAKTGSFYDTVIVHDDLDAAYIALESFVYGSGEGGGDAVNGAAGEEDAGMATGGAVDGNTAQAEE